MAESNENAQPTAEERFFCHTCQGPVSNVTQDFTCSQCGGGFLEKIEPGNNTFMEDEGGEEVHLENDMMQQFLQGMLGNFVGPQQRGNQPQAAGAQPANQNFLGQLLQNLSAGHGIQFQYGGPGNSGQGVFRFEAHGGNQERMPNIFAALGGEGLHGNVQDYAWGPGGLDQIVTQLLNQIEGGTPPMSKSQIDALPIVPITPEQLEQKVQCTTCMDEFTAEEKVVKLPCKHCFHKDCIYPWLERHNSCPICRKEVASVPDSSGNTSSGGSGGNSSTSQSSNRATSMMDSIDELD